MGCILSNRPTGISTRQSPKTFDEYLFQIIFMVKQNLSGLMSVGRENVGVGREEIWILRN
jgi:hypothetical protein